MRLRALAARCGEASFDLITAVLSLSDIVADVLVAHEFFLAGRHTFFWLSMLIFALAQASYAFCFVGTYGHHLSNGRKVVAFIAALPFGQLVPVFTLIESFHLPCVGSALRSFGLQPTSKVRVANTDSLWALLQRKFHAHVGFLVEALVEAIPQCALQISAVVLAGDASALNVISILLSLAVIGSKGWLAAYSLHRPSFVFNSVCIAADVACCFATVSWLASPWLAGVADVAGAATAASGLSSLWLHLVGAAFACGVVGGAGVLLFCIADDHLKSRDTNPETGIHVGSVCFELYFMRAAAWLLSLLPSVTLLLLLRLSLLPLLAFRSLSSEHATHHAFFAALFAFLRGDAARASAPAAAAAVELTRPAAAIAPAAIAPAAAAPAPVTAAAAPAAADAAALAAEPAAAAASAHARGRPLLRWASRLVAGGSAAAAPTAAEESAEASTLERRISSANALIALAHDAADDLRRRLADLPSTANQAQQERVARAWTASLGRARARIIGLPSPLVAFPAAASTTREVVATVELPPPPPPPSVEALGRWRRRLALAKHGVRRRWRAAQVELSRRSEVFRRVFGSQRRRRPGGADPFIFGLAIFGLGLALLAALPFAAILIVLLPVGALYPLLMLGLSLSAPGIDTSALMLPWVLTGTFAALVLLLLLLLPFVLGFQSLRADILSTSGLPAAFFSVHTVKEIERRHAFSCRVLDAPLDWDHECPVCLQAILPDENASILGNCGHLFHRDCITAWLRERASCPLCRTRAHVEEVADAVVPPMDAV